MSSNTSRYMIPAGKSVYELANDIKVYLQSAEKLEVQILQNELGAYLVQARSAPSFIRNLAGMDKVISVKLVPDCDNMLNVEIGNSKWIDKAVAGGVGMFICWPFAITAAIGTYKQSALPRKITTFIEKSLAC